MVSSTLAFVNGGSLPEFLWRLPGAPRLLLPVKLRVLDRLTGEPAKVEGHLRQGAVPFDEEAAGELAAIQSWLRGYMSEIVRGRLSRARRDEIRAEAERVTVEIRGSQRTMRPAFLRTPDLKAALGYVLHVIATRGYGRRLARCGLPGCENFLLREPRRARPDLYCSPAHRKTAKNEASRLRAKEYRTRKKATERLRQRFPARARDLVRAVARRGLSVDEVVQRAVAHAMRK